MSDPPDTPEVVTHCIPQIEVYQVTDDELTRIEEGYGQVGQDFTFAVASLSAFIAFGIALATANFSRHLQVLFWILFLAAGLVALYTGIKWLRVRRVAPRAIAKIRSRKVEPQPVDRKDATT